MARFDKSRMKLHGGPGFPPRHFWSKARLKAWKQKQAQRKQKTAEQRLNAKLRQMSLPVALSSSLTGLPRAELKRRLDRLAPLGVEYQRLWEEMNSVAREGGEPIDAHPRNNRPDMQADLDRDGIQHPGQTD